MPLKCPPINLSGCDKCGGAAHRRNLLHHLRLRGVSCSLCSPCVLKTHPHSFCPLCLDLFTEAPPQQCRLCSQCPAASHLSCTTNPAAASFVCLSCSNPRFVSSDGDGGGIGGAIDLGSARVIVAAARISLDSLKRAAATAAAEAEWRVKEAALARERAREALERVAALSWDWDQSSERMKFTSNGDSVKGNGNSGSSVGVMGVRDSAKMAKKKKKLSILMNQIRGHVLEVKKNKKKNSVLLSNGVALNLSLKLRELAKSKKNKKKKK